MFHSKSARNRIRKRVMGLWICFENQKRFQEKSSQQKKMNAGVFLREVRHAGVTFWGHPAPGFFRSRSGSADFGATDFPSPHSAGGVLTDLPFPNAHCANHARGLRRKVAADGKPIVGSRGFRGPALKLHKYSIPNGFCEFRPPTKGYAKCLRGARNGAERG